MVAGVESEEPMPAGREEGALPGDLDRVCAGDREVDARLVDRSQLAEPLGERDPRRVRGDVAEAVQELGRLLGDRCDDPRMAMTDGRGAETGSEVEVAVAVDIEDVRAARRAPDERGLVGAAQSVDSGRLVAGERAGERGALPPRQRGADLRQEVAAREHH